MFLSHTQGWLTCTPVYRIKTSGRPDKAQGPVLPSAAANEGLGEVPPAAPDGEG